MTDVFLERNFEPPIDRDGVFEMVTSSEGCFNIYRVEWEQSFLAHDGKGMLCWLRAADADTARAAVRQAGAEDFLMWPGTIHYAPDPRPDAPNVIVERSFEDPVEMAEIQAIEDAGASCLQTHNVTFSHTFFSLDRKRMMCFYQAPDAEAVRVAQRQIHMPVDRVWAFNPVR